MQALLDQHAGHVALQFSGGRDSLALLMFMRPWWGQLTVYYCDSGDAFPETQALVDVVRAIVPHFCTIQGAVHQTRAEHGWSTDILQAGAMWQFPQDIEGHVPLIDRHYCCLRSIMQPLHAQMTADGVTLILRGQRASDTTRSHVRSGDWHGGKQIVFPIESWSTADVDDYLEEQGVPLPRYYAEGMTSAPDCMHCTAWLEHGSSKYISKHHPAVAQEVNRRLQSIRVTVQPFIDQLNQSLAALEGN